VRYLRRIVPPSTMYFSFKETRSRERLFAGKEREVTATTSTIEIAASLAKTAPTKAPTG